MYRYFFCSFIIALLAYPAAFSQVSILNSGSYSGDQIDSLIAKAHPLVRKDVSKAMVMYSDIELLATRMNYTKGLIEVYIAEADVFARKGYVKRALDLYELALDLSKKNKDLYNIAQVEEHVSAIKRKNGDLNEADKLLNHALQIFSSLGKPQDLINVQLRYALVKAEEGKFEESCAILYKALALSKKISYRYGEHKAYYNRGLCYEAQNKPDSAIIFFNKCFKMDSAAHDMHGMARSVLQLSLVYQKANKLPQAVNYALQAQKYAEAPKSLDVLGRSAQILLDASTENDDAAAIIKWQKKLLDIEKQIQAQNKNDAVVFIEVLKQEQQRQLRIQKEVTRIQKISQLKTLFIIGFCVALIVAACFWIPLSYNYKRARKFAAQLQEKNELIEQQMAEVAALNEKVTRQNSKLEANNKLKDKLLSVISHDLRHPLANTKSILDLVNMKLVSFEEAEHLFAQLEAQYVRSITLLDNLLFWIKGQMEGVESRRANVPVFPLIEILADEQRMPLLKKEIRVLNQIDPTLNWIAERESVKIIFRNLLSNAVKFSNRKGEIIFSSEITAGGEAIIRVKDDGVGMSAETLEKINKELHYTSRGTANEEGSGLGLMLIRDLIRKYNGSLRVTSTPGKGSEFVVTFNDFVLEAQEFTTA